MTKTYTVKCGAAVHVHQTFDDVIEIADKLGYDRDWIAKKLSSNSKAILSDDDAKIVITTER